ncbi:hypothetical protein AVEN_183135-1 [Araneus ventricosus]|uniref:Uncharacterized protein n=1 Tax=Araneus ventricosus TaxID=182803 RepID=A0A4Y2QF33_ARAVE|nr:hypothetical protein AVEN_183135-1 [Araneus ventricosus]
MRSIRLVQLINSIRRNTIDYGCPIFSVACKSDRKKLETLYNSALRYATGLPKFIPLPLLYKEADVSPLTRRGHDLGNSIRDETWHISSIPLGCSPINLKKCNAQSIRRK